MESNPTTHIVPPLNGAHTHTMILLHGRDSNALDFAPELFESQASNDLTLPQLFPTAKFVFPSASLLSSLRFDTEISQWFDMWTVENPSERLEIQKEGLRDSVKKILEIIKKEADIVGPGNVVLGGISQGCAVAVCALLCGRQRLGGFVGMCSWMPFREEIKAWAKAGENGEVLQRIREFFGVEDRSSDGSGLEREPALETPAFLSHSKDDDVVPIENGKELRETLQLLGLQVVWEEYEDGGHWVNEPQGMDDIAAFLRGKVGVDLQV